MVRTLDPVVPANVQTVPTEVCFLVQQFPPDKLIRPEELKSSSQEKLLINIPLFSNDSQKDLEQIIQRHGDRCDCKIQKQKDLPHKLCLIITGLEKQKPKLSS